MRDTPSIQTIPVALDELIDYAYPEALMVGAERHADDVYTITILHLDYSYRRYLASFSLAGSWTLSPRD